jgi:hypothetical protein
MHTIQFNAYLRKRRRDDENHHGWIRYAKHCPREFVAALGYPNARVKVDGSDLSVLDGVKVVAYCGNLLGPVYITKDGSLVPIQLFRQSAPAICVAPFGDDEANVSNDVVPFILPYLNVADACALGMVCRQWQSIVRGASAYWKHQATRLGATTIPTDARLFCLKRVLHGFRPVRRHSVALRALLRSGSDYHLMTWIFSSFLRRQVVRVVCRNAKDLKETRDLGGDGSFVLICTTRDFVCTVLFTSYMTILWKNSGTKTWNVTSDARLVDTFHTWVYNNNV